MGKFDYDSVNWNDWFIYDPNTGNLLWKDRCPSTFKRIKSYNSWRVQFLGKIAGTKIMDGDRREAIHVTYKKTPKQAHRIIWLMHGKKIPEGFVIDHRDGNPWNNLLDNLRLATISQNTINSKISTRNTSGCKGVYWDKKRSLWTVKIAVNKKRYFIGRFRNKDEAFLEYKIASEKHHMEFARV